MKHFIFGILLISLLSCTTAPEKQKAALPPSSAAAKQSFLAAKAAFDKGHDTVAAERLRKIVQTEPSSEVTDESIFLLGRIEFRRKQYANAYSHFEKVFTSVFNSPHEIEARIMAVQSLLALDKQDQADRLIRNSLARPMTDREKSYLLEAQLPILFKKDSQLESFEALAHLAQHHPNPASREKYKDLAKSYLDTRLSNDDLKSAAEVETLGELRTAAMYQYAVSLIAQDRIDSAKNYFGRIARMEPTSYLGQQSANMLRQLEARSYVEPKTIGAVLPMTGPYSAIATQTLHGLQQALGISGSVSKNNYRLVVLDSQGTPEGATQAIEKLVLKEHVMAIVGGLSAKTASIEATKAQEMGAPFVSLSQKPDLTKIGPFIFGSAVGPRLQVEHIVSYAMDRLKMKRFAVIYPNDRYGTEFANLFWDEVIRKGGKITAAQTYKPGESDFKAHIKKLVGTYYIEDRKSEFDQLWKEWNKKNTNNRKKPPETLLPPIVDFDAIFIPDDPKALGQIAPMLAFNDVNNVILLGTNLWNSPELLHRAQTFADKTLFIDLFQSESREFLDSHFYKEYSSLYTSKPGAFAVQGYDSGKMVAQTLEEGPRNRIDFIRIMANLKKVPGATSTFNVGEDREVDRQLLPLTVKKGHIIIAP